MNMVLVSSTLAAIDLKTSIGNLPLKDGVSETLSFEIGSKSKITEGSKQLEFFLLARIFSPTNLISLTIEYRGLFQLEKSMPKDFETNDSLQRLIGEQGIAQMYPYVRELINDIFRRMTFFSPPMLPLAVSTSSFDTLETPPDFMSSSSGTISKSKKTQKK